MPIIHTLTFICCSKAFRCENEKLVFKWSGCIACPMNSTARIRFCLMIRSCTIANCNTAAINKQRTKPKIITVIMLQWSSGNVPDCGARGQGLNHSVGSCMFFVKTITIYSLGHGLHTTTAVPRSTQPSTLRGMVKWVSAFGLSNNNKWRWWVWLLAAYRQTHSPGHLAWSEGRRPPFHIHHMNRVNSHSGSELWWQHHKHYRGYYYYY